MDHVTPCPKHVNISDPNNNLDWECHKARTPHVRVEKKTQDQLTFGLKMNLPISPESFSCTAKVCLFKS